MIVLYNIVFFCAVILGSPYLLWKIIRYKRYRQGFLERLGYPAPEKLNRCKGKDVLWIHAVSVGEANAIYSFYLHFKERHPKTIVVFSTTTRTGQNWITPRLKPEDLAIYYPIDFLWSVWRLLSLIRPKAFVSIETEIWPNFWWAAHRQNVKLGILNGRLSKRSFRGYQKVLWFMQPLLQKLSWIQVQTPEDAERFLELGAAEDKVQVGGNLKFDVVFNSNDLHQEVQTLKEMLHFTSESILMGGSTHAGEEAILLSVFDLLKEKFLNLRLVLAPRHPERCEEVQRLIEKMGYVCRLHSEKVSKVWAQNEIYLIDQMGVLPGFYALSTLVFMGKSLTASGGQNLLEPAMLGKVVLFGPNMDNFKQIATSFLEEEAAIEVQDRRELLQVVQKYLLSGALRKNIGDKAKQMVEKNKGALNLALQKIEHEVQWRI
ncbi:MAG: hypothetical protein A3B70_07045 [Deltaproteobacteria bacterium RIFCSPHIGHO2_02_FULL_40_11]|nr:MAG: hypothetical protein A3B70_07045 [Deltaproteobacteria bacterium RIFCSPHIGHO2_02_FULL_40_11]